MQQFTSGGGKWAPEPTFGSYSHPKLPMDANGYNEARNIRQSTLEGQVEVRMATFGWTMQQFASGGGKWAPKPKFASY